MKKSTLMVVVGSGMAAMAIAHDRFIKAKYNRIMEETIQEAISEAVNNTIVETGVASGR